MTVISTARRTGRWYPVGRPRGSVAVGSSGKTDSRTHLITSVKPTPAPVYDGLLTSACGRVFPGLAWNVRSWWMGVGLRDQCRACTRKAGASAIE